MGILTVILIWLILLPTIALGVTSLVDWIVTRREVKKYGHRVWRDEDL